MQMMLRYIQHVHVPISTADAHGLLQLMPVSFATVLQQRPFMLFYQEGRWYSISSAVHVLTFMFECQILLAHLPVLPLYATKPLICGWLNDEVLTICSVNLIILQTPQNMHVHGHQLMDTFMSLVVNKAMKVCTMHVYYYAII